MSLHYKKLWKQLIDRDMTQTELCLATGISFFARFSLDDYVTSSVIDRICRQPKCDVGDVMEVVLDKPKKAKPNRGIGK